MARVLLVDDNKDCTTTYAYLIGAWGHKVETAFDGESCLAHVRGFQPDVILLDIGLPGMDGYEVARKIRREESDKRVTLVAVTGFTGEEVAKRATEAGFDQRFIKPLEVGDLKVFLARLSEK